MVPGIARIKFHCVAHQALKPPPLFSFPLSSFYPKPHRSALLFFFLSILSSLFPSSQANHRTPPPHSISLRLPHRSLSRAFISPRPPRGGPARGWLFYFPRARALDIRTSRAAFCSALCRTHLLRASPSCSHCAAREKKSGYSPRLRVRTYKINASVIDSGGKGEECLVINFFCPLAGRVQEVITCVNSRRSEFCRSVYASCRGIEMTVYKVGRTGAVAFWWDCVLML